METWREGEIARPNELEYGISFEVESSISSKLP
jgi:hypothetical protein